MKIKIQCAECDTKFSITAKHEPSYCSFCGEPIILYRDDVDDESGKSSVDDEEEYS